MERYERSYPGVLISAPQGRSGKTIATVGLCAVLRKRGSAIQPFKKGPDYIDPSWLSEASGRTCRNLDQFLMPENVILDSFRKACQDADLAVVEGAMGLFDGPQSAEDGTTAHLAQILGLPIILVVDCTRMTSSIGAMVHGYQHFIPDINVAGVICNNVSGPRHEQKLRKAISDYCAIPVIGCIPRNSNLNLKQRHLGHIPFPELENQSSLIEDICSYIEPFIDVDAVLDIAGGHPTKITASTRTIKPEKGRIGVIKDQVFNFYYPENLEALEQTGAELMFFNSLCDRLPDVDGLYIGGGFPEFFLAELESNWNLRQDIKNRVEDGLPVYAECAGLMYLCQAILWQGQRYEMAGVFPADIELTDRPQGHGYVEAIIVNENPLFPVGLTIKGHEFHHSKLCTTEDINCAYQMKRGHGIGNGLDGIVHKNVLGAYTHLHASGTTQWADAFVSLVCRERRAQPLMSQ